jgi:hypothetical protein
MPIVAYEMCKLSRFKKRTCVMMLIDLLFQLLLVPPEDVTRPALVRPCYGVCGRENKTSTSFPKV